MKKRLISGIALTIMVTMLAITGFAKELEFKAKDTRLETLVKKYIVNDLIAGVFNNTYYKKELIERITFINKSLNEYSRTVAMLSPEDGKQQNLDMIYDLIQILTKIKVDAIHDEQSSVAQQIIDLQQDIDHMLNSIKVEMVIKVQRFSTKFIVLHTGNSLGKKAVVGLTGSVICGKQHINLSNPSRFNKFIQENAKKMLMVMQLPINNKELVELEKLPDIYGYPKQPVIINATVRLYNAITPNINTMVPEIISINKINL